MKIVEEKNEKIFTKNEKNNIMGRKYNPLNKDEGFYEREGLSMKETKDVVLNEIIKGLNWREKIIVKIYQKICIKIYRNGMIDCFNYYNKDGTF